MHHFEGFKSFDDASLNLFKPFTILIGPNGSGKSNVIEAIELLAFIAHGGEIHNIVDTGKGYGLEIRGGLQACARYDQKSFFLKFSAGSVKFENKLKALRYEIKIYTGPSPRISELLFIDDEYIFSNTSHDLQNSLLQYRNFAPGPDPKDLISATKSALAQYSNFAIKNRKYDQCVDVINRLMGYLHSSFVFDPEPKLMRQYETIGNSSVLAKNGANLSAVLYSLKNGSEEKQQTLERLLERIKQLPDEAYQDFEFITTSAGDVLFALQEGTEQHVISAKLLSDGTLRSLAVLTALETVKPSSRIIIEEFDNGLHPSRVKILTEAISDCCKRRKLNVLVTTHNPATLNALESEQLEGVVNCVYDKTTHSTKLIPLIELPHYVEFMERGQLGDLITRRILEEYLAPNFEENSKKEALEWLDNLP